MPKLLPNEFLDLAVRPAATRPPAPALFPPAALVTFVPASEEPSLKASAPPESVRTLAANEAVDFFTDDVSPRARQTLRVLWEIGEQPRPVVVRFGAEPGVLLEDVQPTGIRHQGIND